MKTHFITPFFLIFLLIPISASNIEYLKSNDARVTTSIPIPSLNGDITLYDVWKSNGTINETTPGYYGEIQIFYGQKIWYCQVGGVHNWALTHVVFNDNPYIESVRNCLFDPIEERLIVYPGQTIVTLSNGSVLWLENMVCPLCNHTMHAAEFSPHSMAVYWFCDEDRLIIGEII